MDCEMWRNGAARAEFTSRARARPRVTMRPAVMLENPAGEVYAIHNPPPSVASISGVFFGECASGFHTEWLKGFRDERASEPLRASRVSL